MICPEIFQTFGMSFTKMKLNKEGYDILKEELTKQKGPFSRTNNVMLALDLLEKGDDLSLGMVTKNHLINIVKVLCSQLQWTEEHDEQEIKTEESLGEKNDENREVVKDSQQNCRFYKCGKCKFGRSGNKPDKSGKTCAFKHPLICKKQEMYGNKGPKGCNDKKCDKLHLSLCKLYMKHNNCKFGDACRYFHPKKMNNLSAGSGQDQKIIHQKINHENLSYANTFSKNLHPSTEGKESGVLIAPSTNQDYLGQSNQVHQPFLGQTYNVKQPFLGQTNHTPQAFLDIQKNQKQMMDLFLSINQKVNNMFNMNMQM